MGCAYNASCLAPTVGAAASTFASAINFFAAAQCLLRDNPIPDDDVKDRSTYDFIIVGGGSAGCIVANRLSEVKKFKILLIEAGLTPPLESAIPQMDSSQYSTKYDWHYNTQYNGFTNKANINETVYWPRGKMLGGCSSMNGMLYFRGNTYDYQRWYDEGNKDWSPGVVQKCFKKLENLQDQNLLKDPHIKQFYGTTGPMILNTFNSSNNDILHNVLKSWDDIGIKNVKDLNYNNMIGSGTYRATAYSGRRASTAHMYLKPARKRNNLHVITNALVTKVLINEKTKEADGVEVERDGNKFIFFAKSEVILSAGVVNTPQLLMLSGIGEKEHLESKNIRCLINLPAVGRYLQDHLMIPITIYGDGEDDPSEADKNFSAIQYIYNQTGALAYNILSNIAAFYSRQKSARYPEFQNHLQIFNKKSSTLPQFLDVTLKYKKDISDSIVHTNRKSSLYLFFFNLLHPHSMGNISLSSSNPRDYPLIYPNYLTDTRDLNATIEGIKIVTQLVKTNYFRSINGFLGRINWPACDRFELDSYDYWKCVAISTVVTVYHPIGTARMGNDVNTSVVNSRLKVHKVKKLRVIDASVMMSHISGNINGAVMMIAERGSSFIKEDYGVGDPADPCN